MQFIENLISLDPFYSFNNSLSLWEQIFFIIFLALSAGTIINFAAERLSLKKYRFLLRRKDRSGNAETKLFCCNNCGTKMRKTNFIPFISWLLNDSKCHNCGTVISPLYPITEIFSIALFLLVYFSLGQAMDWRMAIYFLVTINIIAIAKYSSKYQVIPNILHYSLTIFATMLVIEKGSSDLVLKNVQSCFLYITFGIIILVSLFAITKTESLNENDLKFFFIVGLLIGNQSIAQFFIAGFILNFFIGLIWKKVKNEITFPFAPGFCASAFLCLMFANTNINKVLASLF